MKTTMRLLTAFLFAGILMVSCSDDDNDMVDNGTTDNVEMDGEGNLAIGDAEFALSSGIFVKTQEIYNETDSSIVGYVGDMYLVSDGLSILTDDEGELLLDSEGAPTLQGEGTYIVFKMLSGNEYPEGDYSVSDFTSIGAMGGLYVLGGNSETNSAEETSDLAEGEVQVSKEGDTYTVTINCISDNTKQITGTYEGSLGYGTVDIVEQPDSISVEN